ncbi:MAG: hypothetical protein K2Q22_02835 [Cytophagales bacterium]|nr:hypothetical protein [Cytophagales bacterium]
MQIVKTSLAITAVLIIGFVTYAFWGSYSSGLRAGTLVKLSKKGFVFKTYEGQLNMGMYVSEQAAASGATMVWDFSVENNPELIKKMEDAMLTGRRIKLKYNEKFFKLFWLGDTKYIVYELEEVPK